MSRRFVFPVGGRTEDRRPVRLLPRLRPASHEGNDLFADFGTPGRRGRRRRRSRTSARCRSPATACGSTPTAATSSSTPTSPSFAPGRRQRPPRARRGRCSATRATPATPSRPRRTCTSRSTPDGGKAVDPNPFLDRLAEACRRRTGRHRGASRRARRGPRLHRRRMSTEDAPKPSLVERMRAQREIHARAAAVPARADHASPASRCCSPAWRCSSCRDRRWP